jgi:hypothetical protein
MLVTITRIKNVCLLCCCLGWSALHAEETGTTVPRAGDDSRRSAIDWTAALEPAAANSLPAALQDSVAEPAGEDEEEDSITTDRPDFTEASSTVPAGRVQLESGYTFTYDKQDGVRTREHSVPEWLWRIGLAEDFELRLGWNYLVERTDDGPAGTRDTADGAADLYLGVKLGLAKQCGITPEQAINLEATAPTGADAFSTDKVNPGFNYLYGWDVTDNFSLGGSAGIHTDTDEDDDFVRYHASVTAGYGLTDRLAAYTEWFGVYRTDADRNFPENYFNGGFTFLVHDDFQLDVRAGVGLNDQAADFFTGAGFAVRF